MEPKKQPWLFTLLKAQVKNSAAEEMGKSPWVLFCGVIVITALLTAFPFVNDKQRTSIESTNPALYPGLVNVLKGIVDAGWDFKVEKSHLVTGAGVPAQAKLGTWTVVVEPAGGNQQVLAAALGTNSGTSDQKVLYLGSSNFGIIDQSTGRQFDGSYELLGWFTSENLQKLPATKATQQLLFMGATAGLPGVQASVSMLMFVQVVFLVFLLGFLLSLSKMQVRGLGVNPLRAAGFPSSLRTAGAVALGPALLVCMVLWPFPGAGAISWAAFTILYGVRIIVVYTGRFPDKQKKRSPKD